jgi:hypothetical protein
MEVYMNKMKNGLKTMLFVIVSSLAGIGASFIGVAGARTAYDDINYCMGNIDHTIIEEKKGLFRRKVSVNPFTGDKKVVTKKHGKYVIKAKQPKAYR